MTEVFLCLVASPPTLERPGNTGSMIGMLRTILCYNDEDAVWYRNKEEYGSPD